MAKKEICKVCRDQVAKWSNFYCPACYAVKVDASWQKAVKASFNSCKGE